MNSRPQLLAGQGTVIFGGGRGIGRATALALGAAGGAVAVVDLEAERAQATAAELRELGAVAEAFPADVRAAGDIDACSRRRPVSWRDRHRGHGGRRMNAFAQFRTCMNTATRNGNCCSTSISVTCSGWSGRPCDHARAGPRRLDRERRVDSGVVSAPHHVPYGVAKAGLVKHGAERGRGVRAVRHPDDVVAPGSVDAPAVVRGQSDADYAEMTAKIPLQAARPAGGHRGRRGVLRLADVAVRHRAGAGGRRRVSIRYPHLVRNGHPTEGG